jgi:hypothetical protein
MMTLAPVEAHRLTFVFPNPDHGSTPLTLCKYLFDILPPIQHAHNLRDIIHDSVEHDMRARGKRPKSRAQFIP